MKIRKLITIMTITILGLSILSGCGQNTSTATESNAVVTEADVNTTVNDQKTAAEEVKSSDEVEGEKRVAKDGADMQTEDSSIPTRKLPENGTRINMHFGDTVIPGVLNDSETAQALIEKLPVTVHMSRYSHDFCGPASELDLPYQEEEVHYGWLNGDIDYAIDAPWFTILFEDEDVSEKYGYQVNIGVIDCPLSDISSLEGSYDVLVELAE